MGKGSGGNGMTRGDRRRNARRERLRALLPRDGAVIGIDLAEDKQALAVIDHDVRVLARKTVKVKAFRLGPVLDWAVAQARAKGFDRVAVACEPTGPRWMQVQRLCAGRGYATATVVHCESVLRGFYEFHLQAGSGPMVNPFPLARGRRGRAGAHRNPMDPFRGRRAGRYRPKARRRIPRQIPDEKFDELFAQLGSNRDRALVA